MLFQIIGARLWWPISFAKVAHEFIVQGDFIKANNTISSQLPNSTPKQIPILLELRSQCAMELGDFYQSLNDLTQALEYPISKIRRNSLLAQRARIYLQVGDYDNALKDAELINSARIKSQIFEANYLLQLNIPTESDISRLIFLSPYSSDAFYRAAQFYENNDTYFNYLIDKSLYYSKFNNNKHNNKHYKHNDKTIMLYKFQRNICHLSYLSSTIKDFQDFVDYNSDIYNFLSNLSSLFSNDPNFSFIEIAYKFASNICPSNSKILNKLINMNIDQNIRTIPMKHFS